MEARDDGEEGGGEGAGAGAAGARRGGGGAQGGRHARVEAAFTPEETHGRKGRRQEVGNKQRVAQIQAGFKKPNQNSFMHDPTGFYPKKRWPFGLILSAFHKS